MGWSRDEVRWDAMVVLPSDLVAPRDWLWLRACSKDQAAARVRGHISWCPCWEQCPEVSHMGTGTGTGPCVCPQEQLTGGCGRCPVPVEW